MNLLVFKVNQLGDNLVFAGVVQQLRRSFPKGSLTIFTTPVAAPLYGGPLTEATVLAQERSQFNGSWRQPWTFWRHLWSVRNARPDAALISYDQGSTAHILARCSGARIRVGSADLSIRAPTGLTHRVGFEEGSTVADWNWEMGRTLAAACGATSWPAKAIPPDLTHLTGGVTRTRGTVALHAGGSLPYRRWRVDRFVALAEILAKEWDVAWIDARELPPPSLPPSVRRVTCETIGELATCLAQTELFVGNHSGPAQMAAALGCRGVILSGPSHPQWDPPWARERWRVLRRTELSCLPCESPHGAPGYCRNRENPHGCLERWSVEAVAEHCRDLFKPAP